MIIRVHQVFTELATQDLRFPIGDHLIGVHVVTGFGASLKGVNDELVFPFPLYHFPCCLDDGHCQVTIQHP